MNRQRKSWNRQEVKIVHTRYKDGFTDDEIAFELGRTAEAIKMKRREYGWNRKRGRNKTTIQQPVLTMDSPKRQVAEPTTGAKYTRYMKPSTEVSILWGLIKYTEA